MNVVNIPNIFREEEPDPQSGPPKRCVSPLGLCLRARRAQRPACFLARKRIALIYMDTVGPKESRKGKWPADSSMILYVVHSKGEESSGDPRNGTFTLTVGAAA